MPPVDCVFKVRDHEVAVEEFTVGYGEGVEKGDTVVPCGVAGIEEGRERLFIWLLARISSSRSRTGT